jgi:uncharacterized protein YukE
MLASSVRRAGSRLAKVQTSFVARCHRDAVAEFRFPAVTQQAYSHEKPWARLFGNMPDDQLNKRLDTFQNLFVEARLIIEDATDAAETTYFNEEVEAAKKAVAEAVDEFNSIINDIDDADQKTRVLRSNGLKVEQLKGELEMAIKGGHH